MGNRSVSHIERKRVLITVKAYPQPVTALDEMVCTAGLQEDGTWIRIYPIPFSFLYKEGFPKYSWIEIDLKRQISDFRPETYVPADMMLRDLKVIEELGTKDQWISRKKVCLKNVYHSLIPLIANAKDREKVESLAVFKPNQIVGVVCENASREWDERWLAKAKELDLFSDQEDRSSPAIQKVPFKFYYEFVDGEMKRRLRIIDWEIGVLYWKCLRRSEGDETKAKEQVLNKLRLLAEKDLHFFLGTTKSNHFRAPNPFIIIGLFYPPLPSPVPLFEDK